MKMNKIDIASLINASLVSFFLILSELFRHDILYNTDNGKNIQMLCNFTSSLAIFLSTVDLQYGQCTVEYFDSSPYYATPDNLC